MCLINNRAKICLKKQEEDIMKNSKLITGALTVLTASLLFSGCAGVNTKNTQNGKYKKHSGSAAAVSISEDAPHSSYTVTVVADNNTDDENAPGSPESILTTFLENKLPYDEEKYGKVFNPEQTYITKCEMSAGDLFVDTFTYNKSTDTLESRHYNKGFNCQTEMDQYEKFIEENTPDYSGIYSAEIMDTDNDGTNELLVLSGKDSLRYVDIYSINDADVELTGSTDLCKESEFDCLKKYDNGNPNIEAHPQTNKIYMMTQDGKKKLVLETTVHIDHNFGGDTVFYSVFSLEDMTQEKTMLFREYGYIVTKYDDSYSTCITRDIKTGEETVTYLYADDYEDTDEENDYLGRPTNDYLKQIGLFGEDVKEYCSVTTVSDFQKKALFND